MPIDDPLVIATLVAAAAILLIVGALLVQLRRREGSVLAVHRDDRRPEPGDDERSP